MKFPVPKVWEDETVVILAGGPSLRTFSFDTIAVSGARVIAINDSWRLVPAEIRYWNRPPGFVFTPGSVTPKCALYFCDDKWWSSSQASNRRAMDNIDSFHDMIYRGWWFTGSLAFDLHPQVNALKLTGQTGLETDPGGLRHGSNSGYQAINLAYHFGAKKIILLGYDMKVQTLYVVDKNNNPTTRAINTHWHNEPRPDGFGDVLRQSMLPHFSTLVEPLRDAGVTVINATPDSALTCFPVMTLEEALTGVEAMIP